MSKLSELMGLLDNNDFVIDGKVVARFNHVGLILREKDYPISPEEAKAFAAWILEWVE